MRHFSCGVNYCIPLDSRTDEDKAISDLDIAIDGRHTADVLDDIKADKIHGVKWVGK